MLIILPLAFFILKFLALLAIGLFFAEDLSLTKSVGGTVYSVYMALGIGTFLSLLLFVLGKRIFWLITACILGTFYLSMYNTAPKINNIHAHNNIKTRYFKDPETFINRMNDVFNLISKDKNNTLLPRE